MFLFVHSIPGAHFPRRKIRSFNFVLYKVLRFVPFGDVRFLKLYNRFWAAGIILFDWCINSVFQ